MDGGGSDPGYAFNARGYVQFRQAEPRIAAMIGAALGDAKTVLNVGAGAGSYEPVDRSVMAIEPSAAMRLHRPSYLTCAIDAVAEALPFDDATFDAAMAIFTLHFWTDVAAGLREIRRVARGAVVLMTCDRDAMDRYWLQEYAPEVIATEKKRYPPIAKIAEGLGGKIEIIDVPIPLSCRDGFNEAYYGRPEMFLNPEVRSACSAWSLVSPDAIARFEQALKHDLESGEWDRRHGALRTQPAFDGSLRLVVSRPAAG
jgi:SAM-dependent methyltransferase